MWQKECFMKNRIMRIIGLIAYYLVATLAYRHIIRNMMEGFESGGFADTPAQYVDYFFETVFIQNLLGMVLFSVIIIYELVCIVLKR